jgi:hypothetical protein
VLGTLIRPHGIETTTTDKNVCFIAAASPLDNWRHWEARSSIVSLYIEKSVAKNTLRG